MPQDQRQLQAPMKWIDIQNAMGANPGQVIPNSLAFWRMPGTGDVPPVPQGFDPRRLPFNDISLALRDQRQSQMGVPPVLPFSASGAADAIRERQQQIAAALR